jgi:hypothetical protein
MKAQKLREEVDGEESDEYFNIIWHVIPTMNGG